MISINRPIDLIIYIIFNFSFVRDFSNSEDICVSIILNKKLLFLFISVWIYSNILSFQPLDIILLSPMCCKITLDLKVKGPINFWQYFPKYITTVLKDLFFVMKKLIKRYMPLRFYDYVNPRVSVVILDKTRYLYLSRWGGSRFKNHVKLIL